MDFLAELVGAILEGVVGAVLGKTPAWLCWSLFAFTLFVVLAVFA